MAALAKELTAVEATLAEASTARTALVAQTVPEELLKRKLRRGDVDAR